MSSNTDMSEKREIDQPSSSSESVPMDLEKISNERREERRNLLKLKKNEDLQVILDQCSSLENKEPFPERAFERLVQNNVWEDVLQYLNTTPEVSNLYLTCTTFRQYFEEKQETPVLDEILKIIRTSGYLPFKTKEDRKNVLSLRALSKTWKKAVDSQFFGATFTDPSWYLKVRFTDWEDDRADLHYFRTEEELDQAIKVLGPDTSFIRSVFLDSSAIENPTDLGRFQEKCIRLLDIVGEHVYSFRYRGNPVGRNVDALRNFVEMMNRTPNLMALILSNISQRTTSIDTRRNDVYEYLRNDFAPKLKYLVHCETDYLEIETLLGSIFRNNYATLISLVMGQNQELVGFVPPDLRSHWHVERYEGGYSSSAGFIYPVDWPLKVLRTPPLPKREIEFFGHIEDYDLDYSTVLSRMLKKFHATLETLDSKNCRVRKGDIDTPLPKLKDLTVLEISKDILSVDDLLHIKSLENLKIRNYRGDEEGESSSSELVKLKGLAMDKMEDSNIWKVFPNLKEVTFVNYGVTYLRKGTSVLKRRYRDQPVKMEIHNDERLWFTSMEFLSLNYPADRSARAGYQHQRKVFSLETNVSSSDSDSE